MHTMVFFGKTIEFMALGPPGNFQQLYMGVSKNNGTPKSSILIAFSIIHDPFWGTPIFGNTHMNKRSLFSTTSTLT